VIKVSAVTDGKLLRHRGPAVVFEDIHDLAARIDDPSLVVGPDSVLVMRNAGPKGGPGMPEWGQLPIPRRLLARGVTDMVRISDARMSGTAFGTVVLHVAPESAVGGPLLAVRDGDPIVLDVEERRLDLDVPAEEIAHRPKAPSLAPQYRRATAPSSTTSWAPTRAATSTSSEPAPASPPRASRSASSAAGSVVGNRESGVSTRAAESDSPESRALRPGIARLGL
jgi:dihydroxyacid dehydratase/phosphogluconate dehydratase